LMKRSISMASGVSADSADEAKLAI
jgi:hypothetical protein